MSRLKFLASPYDRAVRRSKRVRSVTPTPHHLHADASPLFLPVTDVHSKKQDTDRLHQREISDRQFNLPSATALRREVVRKIAPEIEARRGDTPVREESLLVRRLRLEDAVYHRDRRSGDTADTLILGVQVVRVTSVTPRADVPHRRRADDDPTLGADPDRRGGVK